MGFTSKYVCPDCEASHGPFGVAPYDPNAARNQAYFGCRGCKRPFMQMMAPGDRAQCTRCGSDDVESLTRCMDCGSTNAAWQPA